MVNKYHSTSSVRARAGEQEASGDVPSKASASDDGNTSTYVKKTSGASQAFKDRGSTTINRKGDKNTEHAEVERISSATLGVNDASPRE